MIRKSIIEKQKAMAFTNRFVCDELSINESTYSSFLNGRRPLPLVDIERVLELLDLELREKIPSEYQKLGTDT